PRPPSARCSSGRLRSPSGRPRRRARARPLSDHVCLSPAGSGTARDSTTRLGRAELETLVVGRAARARSNADAMRRGKVVHCGVEETIMPVTTALPMLTASDVVEKLRALRARQPVKYWAFFLSPLGGGVSAPR